MAIISPENQWPPLPPHPKGGDLALDEVFLLTRDVLMETRRRFKPLFRKAIPDHLILQLEDIEGCPRLGLVHGIKHPRRPETRDPFLLPPDGSVEILNRLDTADATQVASILCYAYAMELWSTFLLKQEVEEQLEREKEKEREPWAIRHDWEDARHREYDDETGEEILSIDDEDFVEFLTEQTHLREIYRAIVLRELNDDQIAFFD